MQNLGYVDEELFPGHEEEWEDGEIYGGVYEFFPPRTDEDYKPKSFRRIPEKLREIYEDTVSISNAGFQVFAVVGIRSLLDNLCTAQGIADTTPKGGFIPLAHRLGELQKKVDGDIQEGLEALKDWGNEAAHKYTAPGHSLMLSQRSRNKEVERMLDFCEHPLIELYDPPKTLEEKAAKIVERKHRLSAK